MKQSSQRARVKEWIPFLMNCGNFIEQDHEDRKQDWQQWKGGMWRGRHVSRSQSPGGDACPLKMVVVMPCGRF